MHRFAKTLIAGAVAGSALLAGSASAFWNDWGGGPWGGGPWYGGYPYGGYGYPYGGWGYPYGGYGHPYGGYGYPYGGWGYPAWGAPTLVQPQAPTTTEK